MKKIALVVLVVLAVVLCTGCASTKVSVIEEGAKPESTFTIIETAPDWNIVYDRTTGVMYTVSRGSYAYGIFSPILNADGSLRLYGGR